MAKIIANPQIYDAGLCAKEYIPKLLKSCGNLLMPEDFGFLKNKCVEYGGNIDFEVSS